VIAPDGLSLSPIVHIAVEEVSRIDQKGAVSRRGLAMSWGEAGAPVPVIGRERQWKKAVQLAEKELGECLQSPIIDTAAGRAVDEVSEGRTPEGDFKAWGHKSKSRVSFEGEFDGGAGQRGCLCEPSDVPGGFRGSRSPPGAPRLR
jgi:hypothetical protein